MNKKHPIVVLTLFLLFGLSPPPPSILFSIGMDQLSTNRGFDSKRALLSTMDEFTKMSRIPSLISFVPNGGGCNFTVHQLVVLYMYHIAYKQSLHQIKMQCTLFIVLLQIQPKHDPINLVEYVLKL